MTTVTQSSQQDVIQIRQLVTETEKHQSDPERFTALLTQDVAIVNVAGRRVQGRQRLFEAMAEALDGPLADVLTRTEVVDVTFVKPDVALVSCDKRINDLRAGQADTDIPTRGALTFVLTKDSGTWRIALAQTTPVLS